ncbi:MAG: paraquat-inducible protein A [Phycisphaerales bacterium]|nr:paraquat-inducible protein A [Phycisphaerales bacterium]
MTTSTANPLAYDQLRTCPCCGLVQYIPDVPAGMRACCARCASTLRRRASILRSNRRTAAVALAALIIYPLAITLPMLRVERFGHFHDSSILEGVATLLGSGHLLVGIVVLLCSVVFPLGKLIGLFALSAGSAFMQSRHRALTYHIVEWTGRWGMLDVLLVAVLVAVLKLGDMVEVSARPAALAFTCCVVLSLLATACFDPHNLWSDASVEGQSEPRP